jgi:hypothetical protein
MPQLRHVVTAIAAAGALGLSTVAAAPAMAGTCTDPNTQATVTCPDPTIDGIAVAGTTTQHTDQVLIPVTVTVSDPSNLVDGGVDVVMVQNNTPLDYQSAAQPSSVSGTTKVFKVNLVHYSDDPWGRFDVYAFANATNATDGGTEGGPVTTIIKAQSTITNTPSVTVVKKGQAFVERGYLRRFDGTPISGQTIRIYYVPAGQTRASLAGYATTTSTGAFSLTVRSWYTGSWFVNYAGSTPATGSYKGVWVKVG